MGRFTDESGVTHIVERVTNPERLSDISGLVSAQPVVIADGHHRYAIGRTYRDECRAAGRLPGSELTLTYVNELVAEQLSVQAIHRLYRAVDFAELKAHLAKSFDMTDYGPASQQILTEIQRTAHEGLLMPPKSTFFTPKLRTGLVIREIDA